MPESVARVWEHNELRELPAAPCSSETCRFSLAISASLSAMRLIFSASSAAWLGLRVVLTCVRVRVGVRVAHDEHLLRVSVRARVALDE